MASQTIDLGIALGQNGAWEGAVLLDVALIDGGATAYLRYVERVGASIQVRLAANATDSPTLAGPEFTDAFETAEAAFVFSADGASVTLKGPGHADNTFVDASDPYFWTPDNNSAWGVWNTNLGSSSVVTLVLGDSQGAADLVLADADNTGLEIDVLALLEAGTPPAVFGRAPRTPSGLLLDPSNSDLEIDSSGEPINEIRFRDQGGNAGSERISFHDNGALHLGTYFMAGGDGNDLTLTLQTSAGLISFPVDGNVDGSGSNYVIFNVPTADQAFVASIVSGTRWILRLARPAAVVIELQAMGSTGAPTGSATLSVTIPVPGLIELVASGATGVPIGTATLTVVLPAAVDLRATGATGPPTGSATLSITTAQPPSVSISPPGASVRGGGEITLEPMVVDPVYDLADLTFLWAADAGTFADPTVQRARYTPPGARPEARAVQLRLTVRNPAGLSTSATVSLTVAAAFRPPDRIDIEAIASLIVSQWGDANQLQALIRGLLDVVTQHFIDPLNKIDGHLRYTDAEGVWLDYLGQRLGCIRPEVPDTSFDRFGFDDAGVGFDQGPFHTEIDALAARVAIGDDYYRCFVEFCARGLLSDGSRASLEEMLQCLFPTAAVEDNADGTVTVHNVSNDPRQNIAALAMPLIEDAMPAGISVTFA